MKNVFGALLCLFAFLSSPAWAQSFDINYPKDWTFESIPDSKDKNAAPTARLSSMENKLTVSLTLLQDKDASAFKPKDIQEVAEAMAADYLDRAVETQAKAVSFGPNGVGAYVRLTSKNQASPTRFVTLAVYRVGKDLAIAQMVSNDNDGTMLAPLQRIMASVKTGLKSSGKAKKPGPETWGAIAVELVKGETDPYWGVGEGENQADAGAAAMRFCREAGGKRCQVQVTYAQCGAFASSAANSGGGVGASKKEAEKIALANCAAKSCEIVTSDCN